MMRPIFSIITINYNNQEGLERTIKSVISQTFFDYEFIIIDGGSTDESVNVIKTYKDKINYWVSEPDNGIYNAMNKGIKKANGEYLNFMNSGDCFYKEDILKKVYYEIGEDILAGFFYIGKEKLWGPRSSKIGLVDFINGSLGHQASFIKKDLFKLQLYDESLKIVADWKFFIYVLIECNCSFKKMDFIVARVEDGGASSIPSDVYAERDSILSEFLYPRMRQDYELMSRIFPPLLEILPLMSEAPWGYKRLVYRMNKLALIVYQMFKNKR